MKELVRPIAEALRGAKSILLVLEGGGEIVEQGKGFGILDADTEIKADEVLGGYFQKKFSAIPDVGRVTVEGLEDKVIQSNGLWVVVDPIDGSLDYLTKGNTIGLPYSACIAVLSRHEGAVIGDIIAAGLIDLRSGDIWLAWKEHGWYHTLVNGLPAIPLADKELDLTKMIVIGEFYYPENRELLIKIFAGQKGWLRNPGSAAYEMALPCDGQAAASICDRQKQHELATAYALVKGAGGVAVNLLTGRDLGEENYLFSKQTPVLLAANQAIAGEILKRVKKIRKA